MERRKDGIYQAVEHEKMRILVDLTYLSRRSGRTSRARGFGISVIASERKCVILTFRTGKRSRENGVFPSSKLRSCCLKMIKKNGGIIPDYSTNGQLFYCPWASIYQKYKDTGRYHWLYSRKACSKKHKYLFHQSIAKFDPRLRTWRDQNVISACQLPMC